PLEARGIAVLVPTRGAADGLRRTLERRCLTPDRPALVLPDLVTRDDFYAALQRRAAGAPTLLSACEREVLFRRAALDAIDGGSAPPFSVRAGLVVELLGFYDELRRRRRTVDAFERLMTESLEPSAAIDRGAERLLRLTTFLAAAFRGFEARVDATGRVDEHGFRTWLLDGAGSPDRGIAGSRDRGARAWTPYRHVIVTIADETADAN